MSFMDMLQARWDAGFTVCVGLDSDFDKLPDVGPVKKASIAWHPYPWPEMQVAFNKAIVDKTADIACAFKPNSAFYERIGSGGIRALESSISHIKQNHPYIPVILDAKRADIDNTNNGYVKFAFSQMKADAITIHPYLGGEALKPFLDCADKGVIVLCRTSNKGAAEFQDRIVSVTPEEAEKWGLPEGTTMPLYQLVAWRVSREWNANGNCALVVGATYPEELKAVREIVGNMPILIPGLGTQGGEVEPTVKAGQTANGQGMINNLSRAVIFASSGEDFADAARVVVNMTNTEVDKFRNINA